MTYRDFVSGEVLTANNLEQYVMRQNGKPVGFFTHSGAQSIVNNTETAIAMDTEVYDTDGAHSTVTNNSRYTVVTAGKYWLAHQVEWASSATGTRDVYFRVNGGATNYLKSHWGGSLPAASHCQQTCGILPVTLIVGDYIEAYCLQTSGGALNAQTNTGQHWFIVEYVSE